MHIWRTFRKSSLMESLAWLVSTLYEVTRAWFASPTVGLHGEQLSMYELAELITYEEVEELTGDESFMASREYSRMRRTMHGKCVPPNLFKVNSF